MIDVKNKTCLQEGCIKQPTYNNPSENDGINFLWRAQENRYN